MRTFSELLKEYMDRTGISDAELARTLGVRRQTIFRWKEGSVLRPRHAEDVLRCAQRLRLTAEERDELLVAAGFPPQNPPAQPLRMATAPAQLDPDNAPPSTLSEPVRGRWSLPRPWFWSLMGTVAAVAVAFLIFAWLRRTTYPIAREGETLLLVAPFANYAGGSQGYNVAGRVQEALAREIQAGRLSGVRAVLWPRELRDQDSAKAAIERSQAALAIWGEYDSGRVLAHLVRRGTGPTTQETRVEKLLPSPADLATTINTALPEEIRSVALLSLGQLFADQGDYGRARATLGPVLVRPPADPQAAASLYFLAGYISQQGEPPDLDGAIENYSQALAAKPALVSANYNRGLAYLSRGRLGDSARAVDDLSQAVTSFPQDAGLLSNRGAAYLHLASSPAEAPHLQPGEATARAIQDFDKAIALDPGMVQAYFNRALAYVRQDDKGRWLPDFEHVLALEPDHAGAYNALCWALALEQTPETALQYCERAVTLDPGGASRDSRAIVYAELGRYTAAIGDLEVYLLTLQEQDAAAYQRNGPTRQAWIQALRSGQNPFDRATLERLRNE